MRLGKARVPTEDELRRLHSVTKDSFHGVRDTALVAMSYRLGLRAKELASLSLFDVLNSQGRLVDECSLNASMTKGGKPRVVYLTNSLVRATLSSYVNRRRATEGLLFNPQAALFASQKGGHFSPNTMQQLLHRLHARAGICGGRSHSGRRWFATELISKGVDIKSVSVLMGHSSVSMTAQYAEDNPQRLRRIAAELT